MAHGQVSENFPKSVAKAMQAVGHLFTHGVNPALSEIYAEYFEGKIDLAEVKTGLKNAVIQGKLNPSPEWLLQSLGYAPRENRDSYRLVGGSDSVFSLPPAAEPVGVTEEQVTKSRFHRIVAIAAIYKHQGDTRFYRKILGGDAGVYSQVLGVLDQQKMAITHEEILEHLGLAEEEGEDF